MMSSRRALGFVMLTITLLHITGWVIDQDQVRHGRLERENKKLDQDQCEAGALHYPGQAQTGDRTMNDKELRQNIVDELDFEPSIESANIGVAVTHGVVTLTGHVPTYAQRT